MNKQLHDEAAHFFVEFQMGDDSSKTRRKFNAWLRKSPEHIRAYLQILPGWEDARQLPRVGIDQLVAAAREANVEAFPGALVGSSHGRNRVFALRRSRPLYFSLASAAALILLVVGSIGLYRLIQERAAPRYTTKTRELFELQLTDGSTIRLNAQSQVRVRFSAAARSVELVKGQALFDVKRDSIRPFVVTTDDAQVRALGTAFDVKRKSAGTTVTVVEGSVVVTEAPSWLSAGDRRNPGTSVILRAGQQATARVNTITTPMRANAADATAWTEHRLVFDDTSLGQVVEEFNRYSDRTLVLDPQLTNLAITARFDSTDPASLVRFLATLPDIEVRQSGRATEIVKTK